MSTSVDPQAAPPRSVRFLQREILAHPILYTVLALQLVFFAWLLATPTAFLAPPAEIAAPTAPAMMVEVTDDAAIGGSFSAPVAPMAATPAPAAPMSAPAAKDGTSGQPARDGKAKDRKPKDGKTRDGLVAVPAGDDLVVHLALGGAGDALVGATSPAAETVELTTAGGLAASEIPVRDGAALVRLGGLAEAVDKGGSVPVTLTFAEAGEVELDVPVRRNARAAEESAATPVAAGSATVERAWAEPAG